MRATTGCERWAHEAPGGTDGTDGTDGNHGNHGNDGNDRNDGNRDGSNAMSVAKVIRYTTKPECADENERLIGEVFAGLASDRPDGIRYASFRLEDGVSFVHVALLEGEHNPLLDSPAFGAFQAGLGDRLTEGPTASDATVIGSYRFLSPG
jgi:hypothetical protein